MRVRYVEIELKKQFLRTFLIRTEYPSGYGTPTVNTFEFRNRSVLKKSSNLSIRFRVSLIVARLVHFFRHDCEIHISYWILKHVLRTMLEFPPGQKLDCSFPIYLTPPLNSIRKRIKNHGYNTTSKGLFFAGVDIFWAFFLAFSFPLSCSNVKITLYFFRCYMKGIVWVNMNIIN